MQQIRVRAVLALSLAAMSACGPPPPRQPDPWEEEWQDAGGTGEKLNIRVDVQAYEIDERDAEGWSFFWAASVPVPGGRLSVNGLRAASGGPEFFARLDAWQRRSTVRRKTSPFVVTASGYPASIEVSETLAQPVTVVLYDAGVAIRTYEWTRAGCSLEVTPTLEGDDRIRVQVRPLVAHREGAGRTRVAELETEVVVREGEGVVLGGAEETQRTFGGTFFSRFEGSRRYRLVFVMKVRRW